MLGSVGYAYCLTCGLWGRAPHSQGDRLVQRLKHVQQGLSSRFGIALQR